MFANDTLIIYIRNLLSIYNKNTVFCEYKYKFSNKGQNKKK